MAITHQQALRELADAERAFGWLEACDAEGRFLRVTDELVDRLAELLDRTAGGPVLEVCAGSGELAAALGRRGYQVIATDASPPEGAEVIRLDAAEALARYRPSVVLGCFVPARSGVDRAVLHAPFVKDYIVLGARLGGMFGDADLWQCPGWSREPLEEVARWLVTRHDVWLGPGDDVLRHGEAWHLRRAVQTSPSLRAATIAS